MKNRPRFNTIAEYLASKDTPHNSQEELGKAVGITGPAISLIANRERTPRPALQDRIHRLTGVPIENLRRLPVRVPRVKPPKKQSRWGKR